MSERLFCFVLSCLICVVRAECRLSVSSDSLTTYVSDLSVCLFVCVSMCLSVNLCDSAYVCLYCMTECGREQC